VKKDDGLFFGLEIPFARMVGARSVEWGDGRAVATVEVRPEHTNSHGFAHGGLLVTMLDITMGSCIRSLDRDSIRCVTVNLSTSFLSAGTGLITFEARVLHKGRTLATAECDARDAKGALIAKATGTFQMRHVEKR
jgi:uncharacterized protein (TIGR00369 family)